MPIDIENPASDTADLKAALASLVGWSLVSSGEITTPVAYVDITLPAGYSKFQLCINDITLDTAGHSLNGAFSVDAGANFLCDVSNFDTYRILTHIVKKIDAIAVATNVVGYGDSVLYLTEVTGEVVPRSMVVDIFPGTLVANPFIEVRAAYEKITGSDPDFSYQHIMERSACLMNLGATVAPTPARINLLRVLPYGNGDVDPPTGTASLTGGTYHLLGLGVP